MQSWTVRSFSLRMASRLCRKEYVRVSHVCSPRPFSFSPPTSSAGCTLSTQWHMEPTTSPTTPKSYLDFPSPFRTSLLPSQSTQSAEYSRMQPTSSTSELLSPKPSPSPPLDCSSWGTSLPSHRLSPSRPSSQNTYKKSWKLRKERVGLQLSWFHPC